MRALGGEKHLLRSLRMPSGMRSSEPKIASEADGEGRRQLKSSSSRTPAEYESEVGPIWPVARASAAGQGAISRASRPAWGGLAARGGCAPPRRRRGGEGGGTPASATPNPRGRISASFEIEMNPGQ